MDTDFIVIGGGIAGASAGCELAAHGRVVVLEREDAPGYHTTGRSAALYTENYGNRVIRVLTIASKPFFDAHGFLAARGVVFVGTAEQDAAIDRALADGKSFPQTFEEISKAEALRLLPILRDDYFARAIHEPDATDMDVHGIHQAFLRTLRERGGQLVTATGDAVANRTATGWEVETRQGRFRAPVVVNAAGAWADAVAKAAGVRTIGLVPKRRTAITFDAPAETPVHGWPMGLDIEETFYFKPEAGRVLASPADETPSEPCDAQADEYDVAVCVDRIERATTLQVRRITHRWAGLRSFVADKTPVVGEAPDAPGFFWCAGQGGYGIMTSPAMGRVVAALASGAALPADLAAMGLTAGDLAPQRLQTA
ncbi:FAD-dependent catabolic D-arginine dehydrogenase DauA [Allostella sp. ATCC 35155]|nr:FAD-dependent catabolic D-arginine dehydrogenase DauA [Stella sp. ATCC 35155]